MITVHGHHAAGLGDGLLDGQVGHLGVTLAVLLHLLHALDVLVGCPETHTTNCTRRLP